MKFTCRILKADSEIHKELPDLTNLNAIHRSFNNYDWKKELEKETQFYSPTFEIKNIDNLESISFTAISENAFSVFYNNKFQQLGSNKVQSKLFEFKGTFNKSEVDEMISKFVQSPELLHDYELKNERQSMTLGSKEKAIGYLAYAAILVFLLFVEFKLISENGISRGPIIVFAIICIVLFVMIRFRPKKRGL